MINPTAKCVNCQVLGMQKAIAFLVTAGYKAAAFQLVTDLNSFIDSNLEFKFHSKHFITLEGGGSKSLSVVLSPRKHGMAPRTKQKLIDLFLVDGPPYVLQYQKLGYSGESHKADLPTLRELIKEKLVKVVHQDRKIITYQYYPNP